MRWCSTFNSFPVASFENVVSLVWVEVVATFNSFPVASIGDFVWGLAKTIQLLFQFFPSCLWRTWRRL